MREQDRIAAYKWLIDILRKSRYGLTRNEIFELWRDNRDINWGEPLSLATFKRYKDACFDIFKVDIRCDKYHRYYIVPGRQRTPMDAAIAVAESCVEEQRTYIQPNTHSTNFIKRMGGVRHYGDEQ